MNQPKWKSPVVWISTIANIALIVGLFLPSLDVSIYVQAAGVIIALVTQFGVLNSPASKDSF